MKNFNSKFVWVGALASIFVACQPAEDKGEEPKDEKEPENNIPVAVAPESQWTSRFFQVKLESTGSYDDDEQTLSYRWIQTAGADVTEGQGFLGGSSIEFTAPDVVQTVSFDLVVNDGIEDSEPSSVDVHIVENINAMYFVDGDNGSDEGVGSRESPFKTISKALCSVTTDKEDIYVMNRAEGASYDETQDACSDLDGRKLHDTLLVPSGTSLYGGYDRAWRRDVSQSTFVDTNRFGFQFRTVDEDAWFSGFNVQTESSTSGDQSVQVLTVRQGIGHFTVADNQLMAGDVADDPVILPASSYGIRVSTLDQLTLLRNSISAGKAGNGLHRYIQYNNTASDGNDGKDGSGSSGGNGGSGGSSGGSGGDNGDNGRSGSKPHNAGGQGSAGAGGSGTGYLGAKGDIFYHYFYCGRGNYGSWGVSGAGGNGGKGGSDAWPSKGGGGGGGGGGGYGGRGGAGGDGGCASIGVFLAKVTTSHIEGNSITSADGGQGARGAVGQTGGKGGKGGNGAGGSCAPWCAGDGKDGTDGKKGGNGGRGGAGGGGPSYGIWIGPYVGSTILDNYIQSGDAGNGADSGDGSSAQYVGNAGHGGHSYAVFDFGLYDGVVPVMSNNELHFGDAGSGGSVDDASATEGTDGTAAPYNW